MTAQSVLPTDPSVTTRDVGSDPGQRGPGRRRRTNWWLTALLVLASSAVLLPLYLTVSMSLKSPEQAATSTGFDLPWPLHTENFGLAWTMTNFPRAFTVSFLIAVATVAGSIVVSSAAAFAIARNWERRVFRWSYYYLLAAMFIPFPVIALPQIKLTALVNLDNPTGVAILHVLFGLSFNVLLYSAFLRSVPLELEESARLDGAGTWQLFWRIVFPLLAPMNATVGIFAFLISWNDFMMPSMITADPTLQTLPVAQNIFEEQLSANYNVAFASYLMAMAPTIVVFVFAQRWVTSGMTRGALK